MTIIIDLQIHIKKYIYKKKKTFFVIQFTKNPIILNYIKEYSIKLKHMY